MQEIIYAVSIIIVTALLGYIARWIYLPYDYVKDFTAVGYNHVKGMINTKASQINAIKMSKRIRNVGSKMPPPYPNGWYMCIESKHLKMGEAKNVNMLGENLVVFRSTNGEPNVLDAYCPHLGANLGVGGIVRGDCIECPFHQWTFRGSDGECVNVPYSQSTNFPKSAKLRKWTACEVNDVIFIWYHADEAEPWKLPSVPEIDGGKWLYYGKNEFLINCHIQEIPENGADVAHLNAVHSPNMFAGSDLRYTRSAWAAFGTHAWDAKWQASAEKGQEHIANIALKHSMKLFEKIQLVTMDVQVNQIGPGYVQLFLNSSFGEFVILQTVVPVEPMVQKVIHRFYMPRGMSFFAKFTIWAESIMFERDMMVWNHKRFVDNPVLLKEDRLIKAYRNWFAQFYSANSRSFADSKKSLEW